MIHLWSKVCLPRESGNAKPVRTVNAEKKKKEK